MAILQNLNTALSYDPAIPLLGINSRELKARSEIDICTYMFTAA